MSFDYMSMKINSTLRAAGQAVNEEEIVKLPRENIHGIG